VLVLLLLMVLVVAGVRAVEAIGGVAVDAAVALVESVGVGHRSLVIMPHQHKKPMWRSIDLSDTVYKVYALKKAL